MPDLPPVPPFLKSIRPYVKVSVELAAKDPVTSYYCNFYALQMGLKTNYKASPEAKTYLLKLMDYVENQKSTLKTNPEHNETVASDIAGYAVVESMAMKLFTWADSQDRACNFNKSVVKSFYTSSILFDVLEVFDEPMSDDSKTQRKYARWKATYIHNCLKNNETPVPGPIGGLDTEEDQGGEETSHNYDNDFASTSHGGGQQNMSTNVAPSQPVIPDISAQPKPAPRSAPAPQVETYNDPSASGSTSTLSPQSRMEAEKLCKYAASALQYDDVSTAIQNLEKCLRILRESS